MLRSLIFQLVLVGALCLGGAAHAQQQEEKINKILHPDMNKSFNTSMQKKFASTNAFNSSTNKVIELKTVSESRNYSIKSFLTGNFHHETSFWMGDFKYSASETNPLPRSFMLAGKSFNTKTVAVKSATGFNKHYDAANVPTRDFRGKERGKLNAHLTADQAANNGYRGELTELKSIDDVRALLNKSK